MHIFVLHVFVQKLREKEISGLTQDEMVSRMNIDNLRKEVEILVVKC